MYPNPGRGKENREILVNVSANASNDLYLKHHVLS